MTGAIYYPPADRTSQWFAGEYPGTEMLAVRKVLLHSTETGGWPGYDGGSRAPQLTYNPRTHQWRQHFPLNRSARALRDPDDTPVRENRDEVVQIEIIASADLKTARDNGWQYTGDLDAQAIADLGEFVAFMHGEWQVPLVKAPVWLPYPESYGANTSARMTSAEYDAFAGVLGHMHASGNLHGDPGAIPINQIMTAAVLAGDGEIVSVLTDSERQGIGKAAWLADQWAANGPKQLQANRIETVLGALVSAEADRYTDLANRVQAGNDEERNRYVEYSTKLNAILEALQANPASPVTSASFTGTLTLVPTDLPDSPVTA